ncbi:MAG TPA: hypothetical protein VJ673_02220 [Aromatoleum sp.]|uniref:hypothetical protein n=1 Tax=Aromatoleum sp. TaxID=2307007 RepID=UPI002B46BE10|nr:hypothetical protein [Aromatoleum sp.]HJV24466.1 hypothetical protein [Aromatoleum sp.]
MTIAARCTLLAACCFAPLALAAPPDALVLPAPDARAALNPELAGDGQGHFLLVWQQGRDYFEQQESDVFALRLDSTGHAIGEPIPICVEKGSQDRPKVVFADGVFVVVWHDFRNGRDWDVYASRVDVDGKVRDPGGILIAGGEGNQASPAVAAIADGAVLVWQHYADHRYEIRSSLLSASGKPSSPRPLAFRGETLVGGDPSLASLGTTVFLSWKDESKWAAGSVEGIITRYFARVRVTGSKFDVLDVERSPTPAVGRDDGRFAAGATAAVLYASWGDIGRGRMVPLGAMFSARSAVAEANPNQEAEHRTSAWDPRQAIALFSARWQVDGPVAGAFGDNVLLVAAPEAPSGRPPSVSRIVGARLSSTGMRLDEPGKLLVLHDTDKAVSNPALAAGPDGFVLVFEQDDGPGRQRLLAKNVRLR